MSILGYDCNGRPLRAGDRAVLLSAIHPDFKSDIGRAFTVRRVCPVFPRSFFCDEVLGDGTPPGGYSLAAKDIRRLDDRTDHQPADAEFTAWLRSLGVGVPV